VFVTVNRLRPSQILQASREKRSSLLRKSVNYDRKKFYSTGPRGQAHKYFLCINLLIIFGKLDNFINANYIGLNIVK
jgi:hypothetical protein